MRPEITEETAAAVGSAAATPSAWSPLRQELFRSLWIASVASYVGTWVQDVGATWLMTSLSSSPFMVALVQAATTLPIFLLALPAGALADVVDRRRLLLATQGWMLLASGALGALTLLHATGPWMLLAFTFLIGVGSALNAPAWQAIIPELVPRRDLLSALALNGIGINLARAVGPALGGLVVALAGSGAAFLLNSLSFVGVVLVLYRWRRPAHRSALPAERLWGAMAAGLRYVRHAPDLRAVMARAGVFIVFGSALWALVPVVARFEVGVEASQYGLLLGGLGAGAVAGAVCLPRLRRTLSINALVAIGSLVFAAAMVLLALLRSFIPLCFVMPAAGAAWITLLTAFNTSAQAVLPAWVRGRALSVYLLVFFGGMAGGSALWGAVAARAGARAALLGAAAGLVLGLLATARHRLTTGEGLDLAPSRHWPAPAVVDEPDAERGPVLVTVEYRIDPARAEQFAAAMLDVRRIRLRDGAIRWDLLSDAGDTRRYIESFVVASWMEHLRQHERVTVSDREVEARARALHVGDRAPVVSHFIAKEMPR